MDFYGIMLTFMCVLLIIILTIIGIMSYKSNKNQAFPPANNVCPDYWDSSGNICIVPTVNLGNLNINSNIPGLSSNNGSNMIDFTDSGCNDGGSSLCNLKSWTNQHNILWDGVSNNNTC